MKLGHYKKRCIYCGAMMKANATRCPRCGIETDEYVPKTENKICDRKVKKREVRSGELLLFAGIALLVMALIVGAFCFGKACGRREAIEATADVQTTEMKVDTGINPEPNMTSGESKTEDEVERIAEATASPIPVPGTETAQIPEPEEPSSFEIHFLDVGQGDAALVVCDGAAMLVDGGSAGQSSLIYSYLRNHHINNLEVVVCTHPHEDHIGGIPGALVYNGTKRALCSFSTYDTERFNVFKEKLKGVEIEVPGPGDSFFVGSAKVTVLAPFTINESNLNNSSIVLKVQYGENVFLLMGDAEIEEEEQLLETGADLKCDLIKVGHHGAATATGEALIDAASPQYAIISVGKDNKFGHPAEETLKKLQDRGVAIFRTDLLGHIVCESDGSELSFSFVRR